MRTVGIVGGGLGGLAAACVLAARGYQVTIFERNEWLGGKAAILRENGFRFDMGPTILLMPSILERIFREAGCQLNEALKLISIDPQWRSFFDDGSTLDLVADTDAMDSAVDNFCGNESSNRYREFMRRAERLHGISERYFFWRPIGGLSDMVQLTKTFRPDLLRDLVAMSPGRSVSRVVRDHFAAPQVAQMIDHFTQYVGSAPDASPAVLCGIGGMQTKEGVWYPLGGTQAIPQALAKLARSLGVEIRCNTAVEKIITSGDRVSGLRIAGGQAVELDAVVANSDCVRTYKQLIGGDVARAFARRRRYEPACSGLVLYLGLNRRYEQLLHHNFVFSRDPEEEFTAIYRHGELAPDPTCYVCSPSITEPDVAPAGGDALYVLVHTPYLRPGQDWPSMLPRYRRQIFDKLKRTAGMRDLESRIVFERSLTPLDIDQRYSVWNGAIYGLASHGRFLGAFKPSNRSPDLRGLYLAGGAAHPGPGMPMVLMSGWIAADALDQDALKLSAKRTHQQQTEKVEA
jgi:diapolycopene oxygenase